MSKKKSNKKQSNLWPWLAMIAAVLLLGGGWIIISSDKAIEGAEPALEAAPVKGHPAPEITLETTAGETVNLSDFKGKPVLINFWATWCPPCRAEMPDFQALHRELGDDVVVFSVNASSQDNGDVNAFMEEFGITFPVLLDKTGLAGVTYNVRGLPTTVFVDRNGVINEIFTGGLNKAYLEAKLSELQ